MASFISFFVGFLVSVSAYKVIVRRRPTEDDFSTSTQMAFERDATSATFVEFYRNHHSGRGIWKYIHYLDAYQNLFNPLIGKRVALAEVGVQSGGSIQMWQSVFGSHLHVFGIDINPGISLFEDNKTTVTVMDQGNETLWDEFYTKAAHKMQRDPAVALDILIDDGSHYPAHMLITLVRGFPHLSPGGFIAIEDMHGPQFADTLLCPAAHHIGMWNINKLVGSVHVYPFLLVMQKASEGAQGNRPSQIRSVQTFAELHATIPDGRGQTLVLRNSSNGSFLDSANLCRVFTEFRELHSWGAQFHPPACGATNGDPCNVTIENSPIQSQIIGYHVFPDRLEVETAQLPPRFEVNRMGTDWIPWYR